MDLMQGLGPNGEDDYSTFLDLPNYGFDMPFGTPSQNLQPMRDNLDWSAFDTTPMQTQMPPQSNPVQTQALAQRQRQQYQHQSQQQIQQQRSSQTFANRYHGPSIIPATPNSLELQATATQLIQQMDPQSQQVFLDRLKGMREEQFSPLVSPAITPQNTHFNLPNLAGHTGYYTPRESPIIEPQSYQAIQPPQTMHRRDNSGQIAPPQQHTQVDLIMEEYRPNQPSTTSTRGKKRKAAEKKSARVVQQSPAMKPQRRRNPSNTMITPELAATLLAARPKDVSPHISAMTRNNTSQPSSANDSVSPEPLSEPLMGPPKANRGSAPQSRNLSRTHSLTDFQFDTTATTSGLTPASLMQLSRSPNMSIESDHTVTAMQHSRPSSVGLGVGLDSSPLGSQRKPSLTRIATEPSLARHTSNISTPATTRGTSGSRSTAPSSATATHTSPHIHASSSQLSMSPHLAADNSRKRSNTSSTLQPTTNTNTISPSIKPLLPEGARAATAASVNSTLLLAAKSNYQNIVDGGAAVLGLQYPEQMSQNLTSKRTSHKIAEQGRRQRINTALQEIATLLPGGGAGQPGHEDGDEKTEGTGNNGKDKAPSGSMGANLTAMATSKASTVEAAIEYIKKLQRELEDTRGRLKVAESKLEVNSAGETEESLSAVKEVEEVTMIPEALDEV